MIAIDAGEQFSASIVAYSTASSTIVDASLRRSTSPISSASVPSTTRADIIRSSARLGPTIRGSSHASPYSPTSPRRENAVVSFASGVQKRRSQYSVSTNPRPGGGTVDRGDQRLAERKRPVARGSCGRS